MTGNIQARLILLLWAALLISFPVRADEVKTLRTVVIDPGHGGHDPGAVSGGVQEKDIVLDIALRLGKRISAAYPDVKVIYTRSKDVFIPLFERADIANRNKADLFISLHANYVSSPSAGGTETFTLGLHRSQENLEVARKENSVILLEDNYSANYEGFDPREAESYIMFENMHSEYQTQSIDFAAQIQKYFGQNLSLADRGVKQAGFLVLRRASMPSVLVEVGFISNPAERKFLVSEAGKEKVTESIFNAFGNYKKSIDEKSRFTMMADQPAAQPSATTPPPPATETRTESSASGGQGNSSLPASDTATSAQANAAKPATSAAKTNAPAAANTGNSNTGGTAKTNGSQKWYAVQVAAVQRVIETTPGNFKNEKNITRLPVGNLNKYISGRFSTADEANRERDRLKAKFPDAFVVQVENGIPTAVRK